MYFNESLYVSFYLAIASKVWQLVTNYSSKNKKEGNAENMVGPAGLEPATCRL